MQKFRVSLLYPSVFMGSVALATLPVFAQEEGEDAPQQQQAPAPMVVTAEINVAPIEAPESFTATVEAVESVDIQARIQGFIEEVTFEPGQIVTENDELFKIEPDQYQAQVASAQAALAQAEAERVRAESEANRQQALVNRNAAAQVNLEQARADFQVAQANVQAAQSSVELAEIDLGYTTITSPITGKIGRALITKGNFVGPSSGALAEIVQLDPVRVVFSIPEQIMLELTESGQAKEGTENINFNLQLANGSEYPHSGTFEYISNTVDTATGSVAVRVIYENPEAVLLPGQFATIVIEEKNPQEMPIVPQTAVLQDREGRYVFTVNGDNTVSQRRISTGARVENGWAVTEGLEGGEAVVVQGVQRLQDGMAVNVAETGGSEQAEAPAEDSASEAGAEAADDEATENAENTQ
ncbi:efflux RND transporter periplasmic adaptor subunit [Paracoccaceae bacterium GXU_MW_L88]